jgi:hypothetical protein
MLEQTKVALEQVSTVRVVAMRQMMVVVVVKPLGTAPSLMPLLLDRVLSFRPLSHCELMPGLVSMIISQALTITAREVSSLVILRVTGEIVTQLRSYSANLLIVTRSGFRERQGEKRSPTAEQRERKEIQGFSQPERVEKKDEAKLTSFEKSMLQKRNGVRKSMMDVYCGRLCLANASY